MPTLIFPAWISCSTVSNAHRAASPRPSIRRHWMSRRCERSGAPFVKRREALRPSGCQPGRAWSRCGRS